MDSDRDEPIVVTEPRKNLTTGTTTEGVAVRYDDRHGICIDNFSDGRATETVYLDPEDVPELVRALSGIAIRYSEGWPYE